MAKANFILELLSGTLAELGESKLVEVLQELHDKDKTEDKSDYKSVLLVRWIRYPFRMVGRI